MNSAMTYEQLYNNMVKKFTVERNNTEYKLGDYMLMKATSKTTSLVAAQETSNLPVAHVSGKENAISTVFTYINEKLKIKEAPVRDKTIRTFPLRTSLASLGSALVVCALVVSCAFFGLKSALLTSVTIQSNEFEEGELVDEIETIVTPSFDTDEI